MDVPTWGNGGLMTQMTQVRRTVQAGIPGTAWPSVIWRRAAIAWPSHTMYQPLAVVTFCAGHEDARCMIKNVTLPLEPRPGGLTGPKKRT
jgi:hypothetical protein